MILTLLRKSTQVPGVKSFYFKPSEKIEWKAGQFIHYVLHQEPTDDRGSDRYFTISSAPYEKVVTITTRFSNKKSSTFKKSLKSFKIGESIETSDLDGDFVIDAQTKKYVFIAGGIGITPFRSILTELNYKEEPINVTLLYANRDHNIIFKKELEDIAKNNPNFKIHYIISPDHVDEKKIIELVPKLQEPIFYVSGPEAMVDKIGETLKSLGVLDDHIKQDWFPGYPEE